MAMNPTFPIPRKWKAHCAVRYIPNISLEKWQCTFMITSVNIRDTFMHIFSILKFSQLIKRLYKKLPPQKKKNKTKKNKKKHKKEKKSNKTKTETTIKTTTTKSAWINKAKYNKAIIVNSKIKMLTQNGSNKCQSLESKKKKFAKNCFILQFSCRCMNA